MDGVIPVLKPAGMTSHDVVDAVRKRLGMRKVGHAGTLDPDATGVLLVGVGRATRFLSYAQEGPKRYRAVAAFGSATTTQDASGEVTERRPAEIAAHDVEVALKGFTGELQQLPPMVSAVKIGGEPLYKKALRGEEVERKPRTVTIHSLELIAFEDGEEPRAELDVACSAGTYIRTLVHDLGEHLGCGAHIATLHRTEAGGFTDKECVPLDRVTEEALLPLRDAVRDLPVLEVAEDDEALVTNGRPLHNAKAWPPEQRVAVVRDGRLLAVYQAGTGDLLRADRVVPA